MADEITISDSGPIEGTFAIDLSHGPGVYEFRGARGTGKTTAISSVDWLAGHKVDVTLHDGAVSGKVEGFGVVAPIGGRKRRKGTLDLDTIDAEKFSLTDILDPPGKTPDVRDATRIKALAVLSEVQADPSLYVPVAGDQAAFDALGVAPTDDPVLLASRIKQAFDKIAREKESTADAEAKHAAPLEHVPDDLDMTQPSDLEQLGRERDEARDELQRFKDARENGLEKERAIAAAKERLTALRAGYSGPTVAEAEAARTAIADKGNAAKSLVAELERQLNEARAEVEACRVEYVAANNTYGAAVSHAAAVAELHSTASQTVEYPTEEHVAKLAEAVDSNTEDYNRGVRIRDVKRSQEQAGAHRAAEKVARREAEDFRNKAAQVFEVLAQSLRTEHLTIASVDGSPRLFVQHPKRGRCAFDQVNGLSDGERVDYTLRELLPHIESPGLLPIPQRVWQDLQPADRKRLHELAVDKQLFLFGAQVDDGDLRVIYFGDAA